MSIDAAGIDSALERAGALFDLSRWDEAANVLTSALAGDPQNYRALCLLSAARFNSLAYEDALAAALTAVRSDPHQPWAYRLASLSMSRLGRHDEAVSLGRTAIALDPHQPENYRVLANALVGAGGSLDEARAVAEHGRALAPVAAESYLAVGRVAAADGRAKDAELAFRQALSIEPDNSAVHNELGRLRLKSRTPSGLAAAAGGFATAVRTDPKAGHGRRNLDLVMHVFLARTAYLIFIAAYIASRMADADTTSGARIIPALLLLAPAAYAARFMSRLDPPVRRYVRTFLRRPYIAVAVTCDVLAAAALIAGGVTTQVDTGAFWAAAALAVIARISLWRTRTNQFPVPPEQRQSFMSTGFLTFLAVTLMIIAAAFLLCAISIPGAGRFGSVCAVVSALGAGIVLKVVRTRRSRPQRRHRR